MRFMIIVRSHEGLSESRRHAGGKTVGRKWPRTTKNCRRPACCARRLWAAGPSTKGWRIQYSGGKRTVVDGPFAETKELIAGHTLIEVKSREEALEWTKRFPNPHITDGEIEVRTVRAGGLQTE